MKPWQRLWPRGAVTSDPVVTRLAAAGDPGVHPIRQVVDGRVYVHYSRTRVHMDRDAWEMLNGPRDVLVQRVRPDGEAPYTIALTRDELERVFGEVRDTRSWDDVRCYHFPREPAAARSFRVVLRR